MERDRHGGPADRRCARVARDQHGVLARDQAAASGLSEDGIARRLASGRWELVLPRVYRVAGAPTSWEQSLMAACLHAGPSAAASHRAAAVLWGLTGVKERVVEIATPRRLRSHGIVVHQTEVGPRSVTQVGPIPATDVTRTLFDLGAVAPPWAVESAVDDALRRRLTTLADLWGLLEEAGGRGRRGTGVLRSLLRDRDPRSAPPESALESRLARLLREAGVPPPTPQLEVPVGGGRSARIDFAWPDAMVAVEADGYRYHSGRASWEHDLSRRNALTGSGWRVIHVTWYDVSRRPEATVATIRAAVLSSADHAYRGGLSKERGPLLLPTSDRG